MFKSFSITKCQTLRPNTFNALKYGYRAFSCGKSAKVHHEKMCEFEKDPIGCSQNKQYLLDLMKNDTLDIPKIVDEFDGLLEKDRILNVYVYGSRLYGKPCTDVYKVNGGSDYDLLMIYDFEEEPEHLLFITNQKDNYCTETFDSLLPRYLKGRGLLSNNNPNCNIIDDTSVEQISQSIIKKKNLKTGDVTYAFSKIPKYELDISIYSKQQFLNQLKKNKFNELLALLLEQSEEYQRFIIQQSFKLSEEFPEMKNRIDPKSIIDSFNPFSSMVWKFCKGLYEHEWGWDPPEVDIFKAKKRVIHTLRICHYAKQIANHGKIVDWHVCDMYFNDIFQREEKYSDWEEISKVYDPIRNSLVNDLENFKGNLE